MDGPDRGPAMPGARWHNLLILFVLACWSAQPACGQQPPRYPKIAAASAPAPVLSPGTPAFGAPHRPGTSPVGAARFAATEPAGGHSISPYDAVRIGSHLHRKHAAQVVLRPAVQTRTRGNQEVRSTSPRSVFDSANNRPSLISRLSPITTGLQFIGRSRESEQTVSQDDFANNPQVVRQSRQVVQQYGFSAPGTGLDNGYVEVTTRPMHGYDRAFPGTRVLRTQTLTTTALNPKIVFAPRPEVGWDAWTAWSYEQLDDTVEGELFVPLSQSPDCLFFGDVRGFRGSGADAGSSIGVGFRRHDCGCRICGLHAWYDAERTQHGPVFRQFAFSVEAMTIDWEVRANAYLPVTSGQPAGAPPGFPGSATEHAYVGMDGEVGVRVLSNPLNTAELRFFAGAFQFYSRGNSQFVREIVGPMARLELRAYEIPMCRHGSRLTIAVQVTSDQVRDTDVTGMLRLRIPLGPKQCVARHGHRDRLHDRMVDRVVRQPGILTQATSP